MTRPSSFALLIGALALLVAALFVASLLVGPSEIGAARGITALFGGDGAATLVMREIRLPRAILGLLTGAAFGLAGAAMQGYLRNPLADPGLVGVSSGAALGAVLVIVLGGVALAPLAAFVAVGALPLAAFLGGFATTLVLYAIATRRGRTSVATMLLAGIALAAIFSAISGLIILGASDRELRDLTFWGLGSLSGAGWAKLTAAAPLVAVALVGAMGLGRGLNAMALGEAAARHMGLRVERFKRLAVAATAALAGASVALVGGIGFVGIVVPHLLRLAAGPDHRALLPHAALLGAAVLVGADMIARSVAAPAELPIGIVTAILGAPVFLWILLRRDGAGEVRA